MMMMIIMCIEMDLTFSVEKLVAHKCDPLKFGQC